MNRKWWLLLAVCCLSFAVPAAEPGETRCGADGNVENYLCYGTQCRWNKTYQRCANTNRAPVRNVGDTKCGASGYVQHCKQYASDPFWEGSFQALRRRPRPGRQRTPWLWRLRPAAL